MVIATVVNICKSLLLGKKKKSSNKVFILKLQWNKNDYRREQATKTLVWLWIYKIYNNYAYTHNSITALCR